MNWSSAEEGWIVWENRSLTAVYLLNFTLSVAVCLLHKESSRAVYNTFRTLIDISFHFHPVDIEWIGEIRYTPVG